MDSCGRKYFCMVWSIRIVSTNVLVADLKPLYWALWPRCRGLYPYSDSDSRLHEWKWKPNDILIINMCVLYIERLLHGKRARMGFSHELAMYLKSNEWGQLTSEIFDTKPTSAKNPVQSTFHAVIFSFYSYWNFIRIDWCTFYYKCEN